MTRAICQFPDDCVAGARGPCRKCHDVGRQRSRMRALNADPEFKAKTAERMRALNADPEFKAHLIAARKGVPGVDIPKWVPRDLWVEFLDVAAESGEEAAASHIRRLKAEGRMSEKDILGAVLAHWRALGQPNTLIASIPNAFAAGQLGLTKGLPDLLVLGPSIPGHVGFIELKRMKGRPSEAQIDFRDRCESLGLSYAMTFGRDEPIYTLECWGVVRRARSAA